MRLGSYAASDRLVSIFVACQTERWDLALGDASHVAALN